MERRIEQVECVHGDIKANEFIEEHSDWELLTVIGISGPADGNGHPGYVFVRRQEVTAAVY